MRRALLLGLVAAVVGAPSMAAPPPTERLIAKDRTELGFQSMFNLKSPTSQSVNLRVAPMFTDNVQLGLDFSWLNNGGSSGFVGGIGNYFFNTSNSGLYPYIGAAVGTTFGDVGTHSNWGFQGGVKYFVSPDAALSAEYQWRRFRRMDQNAIILGQSYWNTRALQDEEFKLPERGTKEYSVAARFNFNPDFQDLHAFYGPFINPNLQWGVDVDWFHESGFNNGRIDGSLAWHFIKAGGDDTEARRGNRVLPFAGVHVGTFFGDTDDGLEYGVRVGLKYFLTTHVAVVPEFDYDWIDPPAGTREQAQIRIGLAFFYP